MLWLLEEEAEEGVERGLVVSQEFGFVVGLIVQERFAV